MCCLGFIYSLQSRHLSCRLQCDVTRRDLSVFRVTRFSITGSHHLPSRSPHWFPRSRLAFNGPISTALSLVGRAIGQTDKALSINQKSAYPPIGGTEQTALDRPHQGSLRSYISAVGIEGGGNESSESALASCGGDSGGGCCDGGSAVAAARVVEVVRQAIDKSNERTT
ncbi:hypothetical protein E2C01_039126 [Portunus trituberculatus]|uniref:Uncharacterized protein n=1 Tax=Portunus trituberculatus TaxID=210409 RepID=A0A5B7FKC3_PORTR|nr:hypothetical protein [Portunus trituberculatus]